MKITVTKKSLVFGEVSIGSEGRRLTTVTTHALQQIVLTNDIVVLGKTGREGKSSSRRI